MGDTTREMDATNDRAARAGEPVQPAAGSARPAAGTSPVSRALLDRRLDALETAVGLALDVERQAVARRIAELERRLNELEGRP